MYLDYLEFGLPRPPKKNFWGLGPHGGPTLYGPQDAQKQLLGVLGLIEDGTPRPPNFLGGSLGSPNTYIIHKFGG